MHPCFPFTQTDFGKMMQLNMTYNSGIRPYLKRQPSLHHKLGMRLIALVSIMLSYAPLCSADNLLDIYELALTNDPEYLSAVANKKALFEDENIASAEYWPTLGLVSSHGRTEYADTTSHTTSNSARLSLPLYQRSRSIGSDQADITVAQAKIDIEAAKQNLMFKVAKRYFDVLSAAENVVFSRAEKQAISRQLDQTKQRFDVGLVAITDVHEAQARYDLSVAQGIAIENALDNAREILREVTGQYHEELSPLNSETPLLRPQPENIEAWTKMSLEQNLALLSAKFNVDYSRDNVRLSGASNYLNVEFSVNYNDYESDNHAAPGATVDLTSEGSTTSANLDISYLFYDGGRTRAKVRKANYQLEKAQQDYEKVRRATQRNARGAYLDVLTGISRVKALNQAVISRQSAQRASEAGFEVGTKTTVDVLDSRRELFSAQNEYAQSRYNYILDNLKLKQAAGSLSVEDIKTINGWLR